MTALSILWRGALPLTLAVALLAPPLSGCDKASDGGVGSLTLALEDGHGGWFRLRIYDAAPGADLAGDSVFDTGCVEAISRTYELTNIPVGGGRTVVFEGFSSAQCEATSRLELGYRGGVTIAQSTRPYYHIPIYQDGAVSALPVDLNLSASVAEPIEYCDAADDCGVGGTEVCYDGAKPQYWCVPTCAQDSDCASIHPLATCDVAAGWCMLYSPFPLNLSEPRAFGAAATLASGDVAFVGGVGAVSGGRFTRTEHLLEVFDQATGLFVARGAAGVQDWPAALSGFADLGGDRVALVGGVSSLAVSWDAAHGALSTAGNTWSDLLRSDLVIIDVAKGTAKASTLPRPIAQPTVVRLGPSKLLVAGGGTGEVLAASRDAWICTVESDLAVGCEAISPMNVARMGAAGACVDAACDQVLVIGGASGAPVAELLDATGDVPVFRALAVEGVAGPIFDPVLCGLDLVGGSSTRGASSNLVAVALELTEDGLVALPDTGGLRLPYAGAVARGTTRCYTAGGLAPAGEVSAQVLKAQGGGLSGPGWTLTQPRFAAAGAVVGGSGPLAGRALFGGGLTIADLASGAIAFVRGVEVLTP
ncbi:MAG: hypothetical protein CVU56_03990 [Deltaproteobacteria bacterium HGW-Deltaproteobacteria-14]|jgi:hypothetical protein|nr:MAG: hypothetical protein CVU56_03990 [Deltaproteobacteria bacterium HGW-Deltaproteobacteria-14]